MVQLTIKPDLPAQRDLVVVHHPALSVETVPDPENVVGGQLLGGRRAGWEVTGVGAGQGGPPPGRAPTGAALQPRLPSLPSGTLNMRGYTSHTGTEGPQETKTL